MNQMPGKFEQALQHHQSGEFELAEQEYLSILKSPLLALEEKIRVLLLLTSLYMQQQDPGRAEIHLRQLQDCAPDQLVTRKLQAQFARLKGDTALATQRYEDILAAGQQDEDVCYELAVLYQEQHRPQDAERLYQSVLGLNARRFEAWNNLGEVQQDQGKHRDAENSYHQGVRVKPDAAEIHNNLGTLFQETGRLIEARKAYARALEIHPDFAEAHFNLAMVLLLQGDYKHAWQEYEWRWKLPNNHNPRPDLQSWRGEHLAGKSILVYAEQGYGDTFQFLRFLTLLKQQGATVVFETLPGLREISAWCMGIDTLVVRGEYALSDLALDYACPLMSLPLYLGIDTSSLLIRMPYLLPARQQKSCLQDYTMQGKRIGIVWGGKTSYGGDYYRNPSCPLAYFAALSQLDGISLVSLQKGDAVSQLDSIDFSSSILNLDERITDFADTARAILDLDLVISVDTAVAHLAGALGKPVWLLLPYAPDWRWMLEREDSPWYPVMRLFRQEQPGDWQEVFQRLVPAVRAFVTQGAEDSTVALEQAATLVRASRYQEAEKIYQDILQRSPGHFDALNNLAVVQKNLGKLDEASLNLEAAIRQRPDSAQALNNLANIRKLQDRLADAARLYQESLKRDPENPDTLNNLGNTLQAQGSTQQAIACFRHALARRPDFAQAHFNLAIACLLTGDYESGWQEYEWGFKTGQRKKPQSDIPAWQGENLKGKRVLVRAEQGCGDTLQFLRFLPALQSKGAHVIFQCPMELHALLKHFSPCDEILPPGKDPDIKPDYEISLMSLPRLLHIGLEDLPGELPYLYAEPVRLGHWQQRLYPETKFRAGLVWAGNPSHENDRNRSCKLMELASLFELDKVQWYSLQKGEAAKQLQTLADVPMVDLASDLHDYADTAAVISCLDLVIAVDTSVAHLAGALGRPVWVLLPHAPDWRWLEQRSDSPWYPGARLFRQGADRRWEQVVAQVYRELAGLVGETQNMPETHDTQQWLNRANELASQNEMPAAIEWYSKILQQRPNYPEVLNNLGNCYAALGQSGEAISAYQQAIHLRPDYAQALNGLGTVLQQEAEPDLALQCFDKAIAAQADFVLAHYNRSLLLLLQGSLRPGFQEYEWRLALPGRAIQCNDTPRWQGEDLNGRTILVVPEQGAGDVIQFLRFLPLLKQRGAQVVLQAVSGLESLIQNSPGVDHLLNRLPEGNAIDYFVPMLSLPYVLQLDRESIPHDTPYLPVDPQRVLKMKSQLSPLKGLKVGIVWSGNPTHPNDRNRSCPLHEFSNLFDREGVSFISLQVGAASNEIRAFSQVQDLSKELHDYSDTAALISCLDLVISVDTSVAHLAGALNVPAWILLPLVPDWRWRQSTEDSYWYPSARLFRQQQRGNWSQVLERVSGELARLKPAGDQKSSRNTSREWMQKGIEAHREGLLEQAEQYYRTACETDAGDTEALYLHTALLYQQHKLAQAGEQVNRLLQQDAANPAAWNLSAMIEQDNGNYEQAQKHFLQALQLDENFHEARFNLGYLFQVQHLNELALECYQDLIARGVVQEKIYYNLAVVLQELKHVDDSLEAYKKVIELNPGNAQAWNNLGSILQHKSEMEQAIKCYSQASRLLPQSAEAHINLGYAFQQMHALDMARQEYDLALSLEPDSVHALLNLGALLQIQEDLDAAVAVYRHILELAPEQAVALNNLGCILLKQGQFEQARVYYERSVKSDPAYADAHFNLGIVYLQQGDFHHGWKEYDWRLKREYSGVRDVTGGTWDGSDLQGRKILVYSEQGYGDTFQFVRFLPRVKQMNGTVLFECQNGLRSVLKDCEGADQIIDWSEDGNLEVTYDVSIPLMSIPAVLDIRESEFTRRMPYISADDATIAQWRDVFPADTFNIGLVWSGRPTHHNDRNRSCRLADFAPLLNLEHENVRFYSLQKGEAAEQARQAEYAGRVVDLDSRLTTFAQTAAVLHHLDLLISVDTSVVHLAGAMGRKVWVLLPHVPDWRWMLGRDDSPWYPETRLIRQASIGDWGRVFGEAVQLLKEVLVRFSDKTGR